MAIKGRLVESNPKRDHEAIVVGEIDRGDEAQVIAWDTDVPGFGLVVGKTTRTFVANFRADGAMRRVTIGRWQEPGDDGAPWNVTRARKRAQELIGAVAGGEDPSALPRERKQGVTLREAFALHVAKMRAAGSLSGAATIEKETHYASSLLDTPLASISRPTLRKLHASITSGSGPYIANRMLRQIRAAWRTAGAENTLLDDKPTASVAWNKQERAQDPIPWSKLPAWYAAVSKLTPHWEGTGKERKLVRTSPGIRGDYHLVVLLSGLRRMDAATIRWEHLNISTEPRTIEVWSPSVGKRPGKMIEIVLPPASLLRPCPKGGHRRAFVVPLSSRLVEILRARQVENASLFPIGVDPTGDGGWVFPTDRVRKSKACTTCAALGLPDHVRGGVSHIAEPKEMADVKLPDGTIERRAHAAIVSPHRLRDTYTTACAEAGVEPFAIDVLTNHRAPKGSVTAGYINLSGEYIAACQERVSAFLVARMTPAPAPKGKREPKPEPAATDKRAHLRSV